MHQNIIVHNKIWTYFEFCYRLHLTGLLNNFLSSHFFYYVFKDQLYDEKVM